MVYTDAGEDLIASSASGYAANLEKATSRFRRRRPGRDQRRYRNWSDAGQGGDCRRDGVLRIQAAQDIKSVAFMGTSRSAHKPARTGASGRAFLRGDHQVNETKLNAHRRHQCVATDDARELERYLAAAGYPAPWALPDDDRSWLSGLAGKARTSCGLAAATIPAEGLDRGCRPRAGGPQEPGRRSE